jgi:hypothetical protein
MVIAILGLMVLYLGTQWALPNTLSMSVLTPAQLTLILTGMPRLGMVNSSNSEGHPSGCNETRGD